MVFRLTYYHLTVTNSKGHDQGHAHFESEYLENDERYGKNV